MYKLNTLKRGLKMLTDPSVPFLTQMVVIRRCNLSCGYCNEYDKTSPPVDTDLLIRQIDHLAELGNSIVTLTGGEPLLHPDLDTLIARVVSHDMVCTAITNGFLLTPQWVRRLNRSGLQLLQVSVDNLEPSDSSQKSWNLLSKKLPVLEAAEFDVNINAVLGSSPPEETRELARVVRGMGFYMTVGLMHNGDGSLHAGLLDRENLEILYGEMQEYRHRSLSHRFGEGWEREMIRTGQSDWKCRAGARYLYVDESGIVSFCSQRRGQPGIPLLEYTQNHVAENFALRKGCEKGCTLSCVRRASSFDRFRYQEPIPKESPEKVSLPIVTS